MSSDAFSLAPGEAVEKVSMTIRPRAREHGLPRQALGDEGGLVTLAAEQVTRAGRSTNGTSSEMAWNSCL
jgi:hypothetical protein